MKEQTSVVQSSLQPDIPQEPSSFQPHSNDFIRSPGSASSDTPNPVTGSSSQAASSVDAEPLRNQVGPGTQGRELLVLIHGLQGAPGDFNYVVDTLKNTHASKQGNLVVHVPSVNVDRTDDGIENGGKRLVLDIQRVIREEEEKGRKLEKLSLLGFSLGGIYARYVAAALYQKDGTLYGLKAGIIILVASPLLGVRNFGFYRFIPDTLCNAVKLNDTVRELMISDTNQMLLRMTEDNPDDEMGFDFICALRAFEDRVLYANLRNDFMVNYGTAALDTSMRAINGVEVERVIRSRRCDSVDTEYDERGCKICFKQWIGGEKKDAKRDGSMTRTGLVGKRSTREDEEVMAERLREIGWWLIGVDFPISLPIAHNRIVAMSRGPIHTWINAPGKRVVHHIVDTIGSRFDGHDNLFRTASRENGITRNGLRRFENVSDLTQEEGRTSDAVIPR